MDKDQLDLLKKVEDLTSKLNQLFNQKGRIIFSRYPLSFALLVVFGATMVTQGIKDLLLKIDIFKNQPLLMLALGIVVLIITGKVYQKLNK